MVLRRMLPIFRTIYQRDILTHWLELKSLVNDKRTTMTQEERWQKRYEEVVDFIEANKRNPSKHDEEERGKYLNWIKANRKALNAGKMKPERVEKFRKLLEMTEQYRRKNQYE